MGNSFVVEPEAGIGPATYALRVSLTYKDDYSQIEESIEHKSDGLSNSD